MKFNEFSMLRHLAIISLMGIPFIAAHSTNKVTPPVPASHSTNTENGIPAPVYYELAASDKLAQVEDQSSKIVTVEFVPKSSISRLKAQHSRDAPTYKFNATARNNVVVYFGQTAGTSSNGLLAQCSDPNVDIAIISFVRYANGIKGFPNATFGSSCGTNPVPFPDAPGMTNCSNLATQIQACQDTYGKKVFVSLGGSVGNITLTSEAHAVSFATKLWNIFGAGTGSPNIRPFGNVSIDGFDYDNENKDNGLYYGKFADQLRSLYATDTSKTYYISATTTCTWADAILTTAPEFMAKCDFLFPRFYNNLKCNLNTGYFWNASKGNIGGLNQWNIWAANLSPQRPRIFITALGYQTTGSGYLPPDNFGPIIVAANKNETMLGGVTFWDGTQAHITKNVAGTMDFIAVAKAALNM